MTDASRPFFMAKGGRGVGTSPSILGQSLIDVNLTFLDLQSCGQGGQHHFQRCGEDGQAGQLPPRGCLCPEGPGQALQETHSRNWIQ